MTFDPCMITLPSVSFTLFGDGIRLSSEHCKWQFHNCYQSPKKNGNNYFYKLKRNLTQGFHNRYSLFSFLPPAISLSHPCLVFNNCGWVTPVGQIVTATREDIHGRHGQAPNVVRVFVPSRTTINLQRATPRSINFTPLLKCQKHIIALLNLFGILDGLKSLQSLLRSLFVARLPLVIGGSFCTFTTQPSLNLWITKLGPNPLCKFEIKKILFCRKPCLSGANITENEESYYGW